MSGPKRVKIALVVAFVLLPFRLYAGSEDSAKNTFVRYGLGVMHSAENSPVEVKTISLGVQRPLNRYSIYQYEAGGFTDTAGHGRSGALFGGAGVGVNGNFGNVLFMQSVTGVALLSSTDAYLGGHVQFFEDITVGLRSGQDIRMGISFKHMSSAGIFMPNKGRDLMRWSVSLPF